MEPSPLKSSTLMQLSQQGWGLCHVPMLDFLKKNTGDGFHTTNHTGYFVSDTLYFEMSFSKLFVWNMTQYETILWLDSDTLVAKSLTKVFGKADALLRPRDAGSGPRLGMVHDCEYYYHHSDTGQWPAQGAPGDYANSGVILLKPGHS